MLKTDMATLLDTFQITYEDILARKELEDKIHSVSSLVVDQFYHEYLKNNTELLNHFQYIDAALLKSVKEFIIFIFTAPVDKNYFERIQKVGYIHYSIKLDTAKVKYSFMLINKLFSKMIGIAPVISKHYEMITKFLALVEYVITDTTYHYMRISSASNYNDNNIIALLDKIYTIFLKHKDNFLKIKSFYDSNSSDLSLISDIEKDPMSCGFSEIFKIFKNESNLVTLSEIDLEQIKNVHIEWHNSFIQFKEAVSNKNNTLKHKHFYQLTQYTNILNELIDKPLKVFSTNGFLSLNAGIKVIRSINKLFSERDFILLSNENIEDNMITSIKKSFIDVMAWAIEDIVLDVNYIDPKNYDQTKRIRFNKFSFYLAIKLKPTVNKFYLEEILVLLLDALELNFSIKEREESLMKFAGKAEAANSSKDVFLASISHELRTPINAITGFSQILIMSQDTSPNIKEYIKKINNAGLNLLDIVNTILDFAKLEAEKMHFTPKFSSVYLILKEVEMLMFPLADKKNIALDIVVDLNVYLMIDSKLFKQVMINLVSNAIKFTPEGGRIWLNFNYEKNIKSYHFKLCDTGIGISKDNQKNIFQAFVQVENVYQKKEIGTGLGLSICKKIIEELHKGKIWIESKKGEGSCFHITIPSVSVIMKSDIVNKALKSSKHFLIIDDSVKNIKIYTEKLQDNFNLTFTDSNNSAKQLLSKEKYDLIILNFYLTDGIGSEVLRFLDDEEISTPVVLISSENGLAVVKALSFTSNLDVILGKDDIEQFCDMLNITRA